MVHLELKFRNYSDVILLVLSCNVTALLGIARFDSYTRAVFECVLVFVLPDDICLLQPENVCCERCD